MSALNSKYALLVRRELWEHRALWLGPVIFGVVMLVLVLIGGEVRFQPNGVNRGGGGGIELSGVPPFFGQATMIGVAMMLGGVACIAIFAYLLDCLYAERKDRSILFWKSLPVSDAETVLSKLVLALLIAPLLALVLAALLQPLMLGAMAMRFSALRDGIGLEQVLGGYRVLPDMGMVWLYGALWYSPFAAYLMLCSVLAKRVPLMYAAVPPAALMLAEVMLLNSSRFAAFLGGRLAPWTREDWAWRFDREGGMLIGVGSPDWARLFTNASLWLGLAATAAMVYIVIRLRRYRDDT
jgi:ABC-2 type transport system permease protein